MEPTADLVPADQPPVYVTHGRKYHADPACPRMIYGEYLHDWEGDDYSGGWSAGSYRREERSAQYAAMCGKLPCLGCVPAALCVFPPLYGQTFGHEPTRGISLFGQAETVCQRCTERGVWWGNVTELRAVHILWPCTSAVVLGLVPRSVEQDAALRKAVWGCETPETHNAGCPCTPAP